MKLIAKVKDLSRRFSIRSDPEIDNECRILSDLINNIHNLEVEVITSNVTKASLSDYIISSINPDLIPELDNPYGVMIEGPKSRIVLTNNRGSNFRLLSEKFHEVYFNKIESVLNPLKFRSNQPIIYVKNLFYD